MAKKKAHWSDPVVSDRDRKIIEGANLFTTFRFAGIGNRDRRSFKSLEAARKDAGNDPRALVYAVSDDGFTAPVPKSFSMG